MAAAALGVAFCAMAFLHLREAPPAAVDVVEFALDPPEGWSVYGRGTLADCAVAPDGRHIVFVAASQGVPMLWVRTLDTLAPRQLPGTEGATRPFWSQDSQHVGFFTNSQLKKVQVSGGSSVVTSSAPYPGYPPARAAGRAAARSLRSRSQRKEATCGFCR